MGGLPNNTGGFDRREALYRLGALGLLLTPLAGGCGHGNGMPTMGDSGGSGSMPSWMMDDGMMDPAMMSDRQTIMDLLSNHQLIRRTVEDIDGGIRSVTTSADPRLAGLIRTHVGAMKTRIEQGHAIRHGDPLFREIFNHHTEITLVVSDVPEGTEVRETSTNPQVTPTDPPARPSGGLRVRGRGHACGHAPHPAAASLSAIKPGMPSNSNGIDASAASASPHCEPGS